jgi:hypothetical protein
MDLQIYLPRGLVIAALALETWMCVAVLLAALAAVQLI